MEIPKGLSLSLGPRVFIRWQCLELSLIIIGVEELVEEAATSANARFLPSRCARVRIMFFVSSFGIQSPFWKKDLACSSTCSPRISGMLMRTKLSLIDLNCRSVTVSLRFSFFPSEVHGFLFYPPIRISQLLIIAFHDTCCFFRPFICVCSASKISSLSLSSRRFFSSISTLILYSVSVSAEQYMAR